MKFTEVTEGAFQAVTPQDYHEELRTQYWTAFHEAERLTKLLPKVNPNLRSGLRLRILYLMDERTAIMAEAAKQFNWFDA